MTTNIAANGIHTGDSARILIKQLELAHEEESRANKEMAKALTGALRVFMKPGMTIKLNTDRKNLPDFLRSVRTIRGNDRGTSVFIIEGEPFVTLQSHGLLTAKWECDAIPVSESTGKAMKGSTHGAIRNTVRISGSVFNDSPNDFEGEQYVKYCEQKFSDFFNMACKMAADTN